MKQIFAKTENSKRTVMPWADLGQAKIVNSQGKTFKYLPKSGNIFENQNKTGEYF